MLPYFKAKQEDILAYKENLDRNNVIIDKTNQIFLNLSLNILHYLGSEDADKLDNLFEYNILTMHKEFENVIYNDTVNAKAQSILLTFFLRIAKEVKVKTGEIQNKDLESLYKIMTSKKFKYHNYIDSQIYFTLEKMPENIKRFLYFK
jgi:hypothetical protein